MPESLSNAMGIALYGMFIAIIIPPAREQISVLFTITVAIILSLIFEYVPVISRLSDGWAIIIITLIVSAVAATLFPIKEEADSVTEDKFETTEVDV
jgi:predicted branched-subunit amino acid permease